MNAPINTGLLAEPAIEPGIYYDMPAEQYHAIPALSASGLKLLKQSPAHFYGQILDPNRPERRETKSLTNGTLAHCMLLEPAEFDRRYAVVPDDAPNRPSDRQRKAAKPSEATLIAIDWWDEFMRATAGKTLVDGAQLAAARAQAAAVRAVPDLAALLADGRGEVSCFWIDEATGALCKCRPDWVSPTGDGVILVDGKTTQDASPAAFGRSVWNYAYHLQAAWYSDGWAAATAQAVHGFVFAAVESSWPHAAAPYMLGDDVLDAARRENRRLLDLYAQCIGTGHWPGYSQEIQLIELPPWAQRQLEEPQQ